MFKKIIGVVIVLTLVFTLCSCADVVMSVPYTSEYKKVHVCTSDYSGCFTVVQKEDVSKGIIVVTEEVGKLYLTVGTYILICEECPFCESLTDAGGQE